MKEYLGLLFSVCVIAAVVRALSPKNFGKKYVEMLCSLCVICVIVSPVVREEGIFQDIRDALEADGSQSRAEYEKTYNQYLLDGRISLAEQTLENELAERFEGNEDSFKVALRAEEGADGVTVSEINVFIGPSAVDIDPEKIKEYVFKRTDIECGIIYNISNEK